jgi:hypothetical protein
MVTKQQQLTAFETNMTVGDGDAAFDTSAECAAIVEANTGTAGFTLIWQRTIPAQQLVRWGSGSPNTQRNQGFMHFFALDAGTGFEEGIVRLVVANANQTEMRVVKEMNSQRLHTTTATSAITATPTDINSMVALPEQRQSKAARQDSFIQIYFSTRIQTTTVDTLNFSIPVTVYQ